MGKERLLSSEAKITGKEARRAQIVRYSKVFITNGFEGSGHIFQFTLPTL